MQGKAAGGLGVQAGDGLLTACVTSGNSLTLSVLQFPGVTVPAAWEHGEDYIRQFL